MTSTPDQIEAIVEKMDKEVKSLKQDLLKMCWFMRGGITYSEACNMGVNERELINAIIKDNLETAKKTGQPFW